jgi:hypothetical protein
VAAWRAMSLLISTFLPGFFEICRGRNLESPDVGMLRGSTRQGSQRRVEAQWRAAGVGQNPRSQERSIGEAELSGHFRDHHYASPRGGSRRTAVIDNQRRHRVRPTAVQSGLRGPGRAGTCLCTGEEWGTGWRKRVDGQKGEVGECKKGFGQAAAALRGLARRSVRL